MARDLSAGGLVLELVLDDGIILHCRFHLHLGCALPLDLNHAREYVQFLALTLFHFGSEGQIMPGRDWVLHSLCYFLDQVVALSVVEAFGDAALVTEILLGQLYGPNGGLAEEGPRGALCEALELHLRL